MDEFFRFDPTRFVIFAARLFFVIAAVFFVVRVAYPFAQTWYECQRLSPIERLVTRGC